MPRLAVIVALAGRDARLARSYRGALALDLVVGCLSLLIYFFISRTFETASTARLGGAPTYFAFALVGVIVTTVLHATTSGLGRRLREEQLTGTLEALVVQPLRPADIAIGLTAYPLVFAIARSALYLVGAALLLGVDLSRASFVGALACALATGALVTALGIFVGGLVLVLKRSDTIAGLVVFGLALAGGAYFPTSVLPEWVRPLAEFAPTRLSYDGLRDALFLGEGWLTPAVTLAAMGFISLPFSVWLFARCLELARRRGSVSEY
jgi:ABC-2 type transport system permease protein